MQAYVSNWYAISDSILGVENISRCGVQPPNPPGVMLRQEDCTFLLLQESIN